MTQIARLKQSLTLPSLNESQPGLLNSIAVDEQGNLYYSDEIGHNVVSLDPTGRLRWQEAGAFSYPRGISTGRIRKSGQTLDCIGVADAWNHRVQFFDRDGRALDIWSIAGTLEFGEVSDVRFLPERNGSESACVWLVLDRGNHRLCGFDLDGAFLFQMGRCFPPGMEDRWAVPGGIVSENISLFRRFADASAFDFLYYPERILGTSLEDVYITEPYSGRVKQARNPHLLPVAVPSGKSSAWIGAASETGLVGWDQATHRLIRYDGSQQFGLDLDDSSRPVPSNSPPSEFWVQKDRVIERWEWTARVGFTPPHVEDAALEFARADRERIVLSFSSCIFAVDEEIAFAEKIISLAPRDPDEEAPDHVNHCLQILRGRFSNAEQELHQALHPWCLGVLRLILAGDSLAAGLRLKEVQDFDRGFPQGISGRMGLLQDRLDALRALKLKIGSNAAAWLSAASAVEEELSRVAGRLGAVFARIL